MKQFFVVLGGLIFFIAAAVGIITLATDRSRFPSTVVMSTECQPPCWYGIQPGKTTVNQVNVIFEKLDVIDPTSVLDSIRDNRVTQMRWRFQDPSGDQAGYMSFDSNEVVDTITVISGNNLRLGDVLPRLGQPEKLWTYQSKIDLQIVMLYPSKGILVESDIELPDKPKNNTVTLNERSPVMHMTYFNPDHFDRLLGTVFLILQPVIVHEDDLRPWPGLGPISFKK